MKKYFLFILLALVCFLSFLSIHSDHVPIGQVRALRGMVCEEPSKATSFVLKEEGSSKKWVIKSKLQVSSPVHYGDVLQLSGLTEWVDPPSNPGQFDYGAYLIRHHVYGVLRATSYVCIKHTWGNWIQKGAIAVHHRIVQLNRSILPFPYSDLLTSIVFGNADLSLPESIQTHFQRSGLTHLLVVSGSQVSFLMGGLYFFMEEWGCSEGLMVGILTSVSVFFFFLTGGGFSVLRALLMSETVLILKLIKRKTSPFHILGFSLLLMIAIDFECIWDVGTQLSFAATFSLFFAAPILKKSLPEKWPKWTRDSVSVSLAPVLCTFPFLWFYFQTVPLLALLSNMLVLSWVEWVVGVGFVSACLGLIWRPLAVLPVQFSGVLIRVLDVMTEKLSSIPFASLYARQPSLLEAALCFCLIVLFFIFLERKRIQWLKRIGWVAMGWIFLEIGIACLPTHTLIVTFLDVGQGDSILIETPLGQSIVIDAGNRLIDRKTGSVILDYGERIVSPVLRYKGINHLDAVITTHFHQDHVGGIPYLTTHFPVGCVIDNGLHDRECRAYFQAIATQHLRHLTAQAGQVISLGYGATLSVLYPGKVCENFSNKNNTSVCIKLTYGKISFLLTGDLEEEQERELSDYSVIPLAATVLKAGHHGSRTSSIEPFIQRVHPRFVVVSVGKNNHFGHPSQEVLDRFKQAHISLFRTDLDGAVEFSTDGNTLHFKRYKQNVLAK